MKTTKQRYRFIDRDPQQHETLIVIKPDTAQTWRSMDLRQLHQLLTELETDASTDEKRARAAVGLGAQPGTLRFEVEVPGQQPVAVEIRIQELSFTDASELVRNAIRSAHFPA